MRRAPATLPFALSLLLGACADPLPAPALRAPLVEINDNGIACNADPPDGATQADPLPVYAGVCPTLAPAPAGNTIKSSGYDRKFMVAIPAGLQQNEKLPVVFLWHWLGGSADKFYTRGEIQAAVDTQRFIAVLPEARGDLIFKWPFNVLDPQARMDEEYQFFDDMLACVAAQFSTINKNCVASAGVSAGALFTDQLGAGRPNRLSSILSLSGGVDTGIIRDWGKPAHRVPALILWGGDNDNCFGLMDFKKASMALEDQMSPDGNFVVECVHNCGHAEPPFEAPPGLSRYAGFWQFVFDHPFWLGPGESPYNDSGLPASFPDWCSIGQGSSTPRTGACADPPGC